MFRPPLLAKNERLEWSTGSGTDVWDMFCAAMAGDLDTINRLLDKDPTLVRGAYDYRVPLHFAVRENQLAAAKLLLQRGASPANGVLASHLETARDRGYAAMQRLLEDAIAGPGNAVADGETIAAAIRTREYTTLKNLLDANPHIVHAADERTNRPIHWAVMTRQIELIDELLTRGADINAQRADGARAVQLTNGDYHYRGWAHKFDTTPAEVLAHLRSRGAYVDICTASAAGDIARVRQLLQEDPTLANKCSDYVTYYTCSGAPIRNAAARGHIDIVRLLLRHGANPNLPEEGIAPRGHALHSAVCNGHIEIVKLLLAHGAYPNVDVESSADTLSFAIGRDDKPMIELLCSHGAARAVHLLAYSGDLPTAAAVFAANPALADDTYALECAAGQGHAAFVRLMLRYKPGLASRIAVGVDSQGPQGLAAAKELTEYLFARGMNPNLPNWLGIRPLHKFAGRGDVENAALFIEHGADVNVRDEELCSTPLGWAAKQGKLAMVELLLAHAAKTNLPDDPAWATPLAWATRRGHNDVATLLKQHGAA